MSPAKFVSGPSAEACDLQELKKIQDLVFVVLRMQIKEMRKESEKNLLHF